jgi:hypothetical protein
MENDSAETEDVISQVDTVILTQKQLKEHSEWCPLAVFQMKQQIIIAVADHLPNNTSSLRKVAMPGRWCIAEYRVGAQCW